MINCSLRAIYPFLSVFSDRLDNFTAIFVKFEIVVYKLFQFGRVKNCRLGKGQEWLVNMDPDLCAFAAECFFFFFK